MVESQRPVEITEKTRPQDRPIVEQLAEPWLRGCTCWDACHRFPKDECTSDCEELDNPEQECPRKEETDAFYDEGLCATCRVDPCPFGHDPPDDPIMNQALAWKCSENPFLEYLYEEELDLPR